MDRRLNFSRQPLFQILIPELFYQQNRSIMLVKSILRLMLADHNLKELVLAFPSSSLVIQRQPDGQLFVSNKAAIPSQTDITTNAIPPATPDQVQVFIQCTWYGVVTPT